MRHRNALFAAWVVLLGSGAAGPAEKALGPGRPVLGIASASAAASDATGAVDSMDQAEQWFTEKPKGVPVVTLAACEGRGGQPASALAVKVGEGKLYGLAMRRLQPEPAWGQSDGLAFWVKGDGSENWGNIRIQAGDYRKARVASFPLKETQWHEVKLAWGDFVPTTALWAELGSADGARPGDVDLVGFGKDWNFNLLHKSPEITFSIDDLGLVKGVKSSRRTVPIGTLPALSSVVRKLKAGRPVTILALGDSITWGTSAGGNQNAYPAVLAGLLKEFYHNEQITVVSRAIGGSTTSRGREWLMRDIQGLEADLITAMFGYNEKPAPDSDAAAATTHYVANLIRYVEEVAGTLKAPPACVLLAPTPGRQVNWAALDAYAQGVRDLVKRHENLTLADANAHMKQLGQEAYGKLMADEAHPNPEGQKEMAGIVFRAITGQTQAHPQP